MEPVSSVSPPSSDTAAPDATLSGGDVDATWSGTDGGEEAVGGSTPTPDQDVVDELGKAVGITYDDAEPLRFGDKVADRDVQRWELNPLLRGISGTIAGAHRARHTDTDKSPDEDNRNKPTGPNTAPNRIRPAPEGHNRKSTDLLNESMDGR